MIAAITKRIGTLSQGLSSVNAPIRVAAEECPYLCGACGRHSNPAVPAISLPALTRGSFQTFRCEIEQDRQQHQLER